MSGSSYPRRDSANRRSRLGASCECSPPVSSTSGPCKEMTRTASLAGVRGIPNPLTGIADRSRPIHVGKGCSHETIAYLPGACARCSHRGALRRRVCRRAGGTHRYGSPTVTGTASVGQALTAENGAWANTPAVYQSVARSGATGKSCVGVPGATQKTYLVVAADRGARSESGLLPSTPTARPARARHRRLLSGRRRCASEPVRPTITATRRSARS